MQQSAVYFYGGWPFLTGLVAELRARLPGMMTLVALASGAVNGESAIAAGALYRAAGILLLPALGAVLMSASTVLVALNARRLSVLAAPPNQGAKQEPDS